MFCRFCGKEALEGQTFCPYCGKKAEVSIKNEEPVYIPPVRTQPVQSVSAFEPQINQDTAPAEKKKKSKLSVVIVAIVLVAAIIAGVMFVPGFLKDKDKKDTVTVWVISEFNYDNILEMKFKHREDGFFSEATRYFYSDIITENIVSYVYDKNYNVIEMIYDNSEHIYMSYDEKDNMISREGYFNGEEVSSFNRYDYDKDGRIIKKTTEYSEYFYEYDNRGNLICEYEVGSIDKTYHRYDSENNILETQSGNRKDIYKYDENNRLVEIIRYVDAYEEARCEFQYDDNGNLICVKKRDSQDEGEIKGMHTIKYISMEVDPDMAQILKEKQDVNFVIGDIYRYSTWF